MRVITIKEGPCRLILSGAKTTEYRGRDTKPGPILIHCGAPTSAIVAIAEVIETYAAEQGGRPTYAWALSNVRPLAAPIPLRGQLGWQKYEGQLGELLSAIVPQLTWRDGPTPPWATDELITRDGSLWALLWCQEWHQP